MHNAGNNNNVMPHRPVPPDAEVGPNNAAGHAAENNYLHNAANNNVMRHHPVPPGAQVGPPDAQVGLNNAVGHAAEYNGNPLQILHPVIAPIGIPNVAAGNQGGVVANAGQQNGERNEGN